MCQLMHLHLGCGACAYLLYRELCSDKSRYPRCSVCQRGECNILANLCTRTPKHYNLLISINSPALYKCRQACTIEQHRHYALQQTDQWSRASCKAEPGGDQRCTPHQTSEALASTPAAAVAVVLDSA